MKSKVDGGRIGTEKEAGLGEGEKRAKAWGETTTTTLTMNLTTNDTGDEGGRINVSMDRWQSLGVVGIDRLRNEGTTHPVEGTTRTDDFGGGRPEFSRARTRS